MSRSVEQFIAWRYLKAPRKEGFISVVAGFSFLGIFLGVATLIIVMSVMNGFRQELCERLLGFNGHLTLFVEKPLSPREIEGVRSMPGVRGINPLLDRQGMCFSENPGSERSSGCMIRCVSKADLKNRPLIADHIVSGSLKGFQENKVLLGHKLAQALGVKVGDILRIMRPEGKATAFGTMPYSRHFTICGLFDSGMHEYDKICLFMPLEAGIDFFEAPQIKTYEIFVENLDHIKEIKHLLSHPHWKLYDWQYSNSNFFKAIQVQSNVMFLILTLIVLVAVFNIISCLVMLVKDKTKDIAILRTLGATRGTIMRIFFMTGAWIGVISTLAGTATGLLFASHIDTIRKFLESISGTSLFQAEIYFLASLPSRVDLWDVALVMAMALVFSFLATLYPAWKASRLSPVEGLRYE